MNEARHFLPPQRGDENPYEEIKKLVNKLPGHREQAENLLDPHLKESAWVNFRHTLMAIRWRLDEIEADFKKKV